MYFYHFRSRRASPSRRASWPIARVLEISWHALSSPDLHLPGWQSAAGRRHRPTWILLNRHRNRSSLEMPKYRAGYMYCLQNRVPWHSHLHPLKFFFPTVQHVISSIDHAHPRWLAEDNRYHPLPSHLKDEKNTQLSINLFIT